MGEESGGKEDVLCAHALAGPPGSIFYDLRIQNEADVFRCILGGRIE